MPRGDGTGPVGMGSMTGRGMGICTGYANTGYASTGLGAGRGRGFRRTYYATGLPRWVRYGAYPYDGYQGTAPAVDSKEAVKNQVDFLEMQLKDAKERLNSFEKEE